MSDGTVQVQPDSTGKKIDASELTRADGTIVERQRIALADDQNPSTGGVSAVREGRLQVEDRTLHVLEEMNENIKVIRFMLEHIND